MIDYGKGRVFDEGNIRDPGVHLASVLNASTTPVTYIDILGTARGTKSPWFEGPTTAIDWHGFVLLDQNQWEPFTWDRKVAIDIAIGPIGSEQLVLADCCFDQPGHIRPSRNIFIPLYIPKGTIMHFRAMVYANLTSGTWSQRPAAHGYHQPFTYQHLSYRSETVGIKTVASPVSGNGYGTLVDPTVANTMTSWESLGTTTFDWHSFHIQVGQGFNGVNPTITSSAGPYDKLYDIAIGTTKTLIIEGGYVSINDAVSGETRWNNGALDQYDTIRRYIPAGTEIFARMQSSAVVDVAARSNDFRVIGFG